MTAAATRPTKKLLKRRDKTKVTQPQDVAYPELENLLANMKAIQDEALAKGKIFLELEARALSFMKERGIDSYDHGPIKGTAVAPTGENVDWAGIKGELTPEQWQSILGEPQPEKSKLQALIELKQVSADTIKPFVTDKPIKPHIKLTRRAA